MDPKREVTNRRPPARQFLLFAAVGAAGFIVDAVVLYTAMMACGLGPYVGRVVSYLAAATFTWSVNRRYTFADQASEFLLREWARFLAANAVGGLVNYATYAALLLTFPTAVRWPILGVAAGSIAGLVVNFALSRRLVFNARPDTPAGD